MIIGFDGSRAFNKDNTGTENYSYQLLKHLAKIDRENEYIVYTRPGTHVIPDIPDPESRTGSRTSYGMTVKEWPNNFQFKTINFPRLWTQAGLALQTVKDPLDILFVPAHTLPLLRKPGLKTVITVHDLGAEYLPQMHQLKQRLYLSWMTQKQLKTSTKIIAVSKATKEDIIKRAGIDSKKIEVVYEGVNRELFKPVKGDALADILRQYGLEKGKYFLFVGTIQPRKNLVRLIEAFASFVYRLPSTVQLALVGSKGWLSDDIYLLPKKLRMRQSLAPSALEDKVKFLGRVEDKDLPALYSGAIALTFPSLFEGFGLPILEAFACHCPVLTSSTSSMPEVAGDAAILVDAYNIDSISNGMKKIAKMEERVKLVSKGMKQLEKFSWEKAARETIAVLEETASIL